MTNNNGRGTFVDELSFLNQLRDRRASVSPNFKERKITDDRAGDGFPQDQEHGPKPSEVYGFVGSITTVIATVIHLVWAYAPEPLLHSLGITYYPSKYWALAVPSVLIVLVFCMLVLYLGLNFLAMPPTSAHSTIYEEYSCERTTFYLTEGKEKPIDLIADVRIDQINYLMFLDTNQ
ncbi:Phosphatidylinositol N-acetylglucosaminyltransferase subunit P [Rhynchospora pubera]|uniref:Phosphatidylinositol N-acetylglucosaminyltransferase subunit P n=1 Tax=Rhynchospora pubera TaxID=906938 RepID=A0AAV8E5Z5_9POAL|nr:Phosphatidylinositol N-acetylglucosaminyltransferase subunit P [Rhynchospora pubera]